MKQKAGYCVVLDLPTDIKRDIASFFGVSVRTVNRALEISNPLMTEVADRIRVRAYDLGAIRNKKLVFRSESTIN